jgi:hypothetical protein
MTHMQILSEGLFVIREYLWQVSIFLITCTGLGLAGLFLNPATRKLPALAKVCLGLPLGPLILAMISYGFIQMSRLWAPALRIGGFLLVGVGCAISLLFIWRAHPWKQTGFRWMVAFGIVLSSVLYLALRLVFVKNLLLPPYYDSVEHYRILTSFLSPSTTPGLFSGSYYHVGFHSIAAWWVTVCGLPPAQAITLLGQLFLFVVPFSLFGMLYVICKNWKPALAVALVGTFYWTMPAYAANWGKYPTLAAIAVLPAATAILFVLLKDKKILQFILVGFFLLVGVALLHSRAALCLLILVGCLVLDGMSSRKMSVRTLRVFAFIGLGIFLLLFFLNTSLIWLYAFPIFTFGVAIALMALCTFFSPRLSMSVWLSSLLVIILTFIPVPGFLRQYSLHLIDQPFLQTWLFLPFSVSVGVGLVDGMDLVGKKRWLQVLYAIFLAGLFGFVLVTKSFTPDKCCNYVNQEDLQTILQIKAKLPGDAVIAIPGQIDHYPYMGTDAGIWINSLTGRQTILLPYDFEWFLQSKHDEVCSRGEMYIFSGTFLLSFQINEITHTDWYQTEFSNGKSRIYKAIGCKGS